MEEKRMALSPVDNRKSFYNKAYVLYMADGSKVLESYGTKVCRVTADSSVQRLWNGYSATTMRHVNSFMASCNLPYGGKKWWEGMEVERF
jgi:hypothetical protein